MSRPIVAAPCAKCPFRKDVPNYLRAGRRDQIARALTRGEDFPCHEHTDVETDDEGHTVQRNLAAPLCAGAAKALLAEGRTTQSMRIVERLGIIPDLDEYLSRGADVWPLSVWQQVPEGRSAADWSPDDADDVEPCHVAGAGCTAPAGWMEGGTVVVGSVSADHECVACGEPTCFECMATDELCAYCEDEEG